ncbi:MAG: carboxylesterase family protein, partial [Muribaculaceae bacterium]|nr:carboxylesterase family protein [Muribaculaceae bacterium]
MKQLISLVAAGILVSAVAEAKSPIGHITTDGIVTETMSGPIAGYRDASGIFTYKGIPYAKAERFCAPTDVEKWEAPRSCRNFGPTAPQGERQGWLNDPIAFAFNWDDGFPGEDCQRLNIWTKAAGKDGQKRPVMVWLHGGGYSAGSGQELPGYDGANLAAKGDVVVVSLNHRLNVLGFLDLSDFDEKYTTSANAGMLDIVAALQWVNKNIENFGGDPDNVTIFGQSGGGGKVSTLLAMPSAQGLFHKAIVQSGSAGRTMTSDMSRRIGRAVVEELGLADNVNDIATVPYADLLAAGNKAIAKVKAEVENENGTVPFIFGWAPSVDGNVLPMQPFDGVAPEICRDVPMMIGTTRCEFSP